MLKSNHSGLSRCLNTNKDRFILLWIIVACLFFMWIAVVKSLTKGTWKFPAIYRHFSVWRTIFGNVSMWIRQRKECHQKSGICICILWKTNVRRRPLESVISVSKYFSLYIVLDSIYSTGPPINFQLPPSQFKQSKARDEISNGQDGILNDNI